MKMKQYLLIIILISTCNALHAQSGQQTVQVETKIIDNYKRELSSATNDTTKSLLMGKLAVYYQSIDLDSSLKYGMKSLQLAERSGYPHYISRALAGLSGRLSQQGKFVEALDVLYKSLTIAQDNNLKEDIA